MPYPTHLLPTTVVGSYPQPDWLVDRAALREAGVPRVHAHGIWRVAEAFLEQAQDDGTILAIQEMERAGIDIVTDGEIRRESYSNRFALALEGIDTIVLSGGSAFGLDAASGVQAYMREQGRGFRIRDAVVPIIPGAIMFDLLNGGNKDWGQYPPYREFGYEAAKSASQDFPLGSIGAGLGATTVNLKGGVGSASAQVRGITVGAIVVVNAVGTTIVGDNPHFWAAPFEQNQEFGGRGWPAKISPPDLAIRAKGGPQENTTIAVIATDAQLNKAQCHRLAVMAQDGLARAIYPVHTPLDGDVVFSAATGAKPLPDPYYGLAELGMVAANVMARAIARGIYEATALPFPGALPSWHDRFG